MPLHVAKERVDGPRRPWRGIVWPIERGSTFMWIGDTFAKEEMEVADRHR